MKQNNFQLDQYYNSAQETHFSSKNPQLLEWVDFFTTRFRQKKIFETFSLDFESSTTNANIVAIAWHQFSEFMPYFLCQACALLSSNEKRHFAIQTAFEELGMRNVNKIHHNMFWDAAKSANCAEDVIKYFTSIKTHLSWLKFLLLKAKNDSYVLGILMGLEGPAEENIELIFNSLAHDEPSKKILASHEFFVVHRQVEVEHVRLTVANFLRFCEKTDDRKDFINGFDDGIEFWNRFWNTVKLELNALKH